MAVWEIGFEGETFEWDDSSLMLSEAREIKKWLKVNPPDWLEMLASDDPDASTALLCILNRRAGRDVRFSDLDGDLKTLTFKLKDGEVAEDGEKPDPTPDVE